MTCARPQTKGESSKSTQRRSCWVSIVGLLWGLFYFMVVQCLYLGIILGVYFFKGVNSGVCNYFGGHVWGLYLFRGCCLGTVLIQGSGLCLNLFLFLLKLGMAACICKSCSDIANLSQSFDLDSGSDSAMLCSTILIYRTIPNSPTSIHKIQVLLHMLILLQEGRNRCKSVANPH